MSALDLLGSELSHANTRLRREHFGSTKPMAELALRLQKRFGDGVAPVENAILAAVRRFVKLRQVESFRDAKLSCYGIAMEVLPERIILMREPQLVGALLEAVQGLQSQPRKFRRCFQALMTAYFEHDPTLRPDDVASLQSWTAIRRLLASGLGVLKHEPMPEWAEEITKHGNLFEGKPCAPYGEAILEGNLTRVLDEFARIGIAKSSWVQRDVLIEAIEAACDSSDHRFKNHVEYLLDLLRENPIIQLMGLRKILNRYARMNELSEHKSLRVFSVDLLGNPLLLSNSPRWEGVSLEAKKMVSDWLKLQLIEQFFELLSHDGATDTRRVKFWAEYVSVIENVWFVLGSSARWNPDFRKLWALMGDQAVNLEGATSENNAFVMKIGDLLIVEFGKTGNAAYMFDATNPPFQLHGSVHLKNDLKHRRNLGSMDHRDGHELWEHKFRRTITEHTSIRNENPFVTHRSKGARPSEEIQSSLSNPAGGVFMPNNFEHLFKSFCAERGLRFKDWRATGGKLIVHVNADNPKISGTLGQWGFKFDRRAGVWMKDR